MDDIAWQRQVHAVLMCLIYRQTKSTYAARSKDAFQLRGSLKKFGDGKEKDRVRLNPNPCDHLSQTLVFIWYLMMVQAEQKYSKAQAKADQAEADYNQALEYFASVREAYQQRMTRTCKVNMPTLSSL